MEHVGTDMYMPTPFCRILILVFLTSKALKSFSHKNIFLIKDCLLGEENSQIQKAHDFFLEDCVFPWKFSIMANNPGLVGELLTFID